MSNGASSIGSVGTPVYDAHNNRVKGFHGYVVDDPYQAGEIIENSRRMARVTGATRISIRFVVETEKFAAHKYNSKTGLWLPSGNGMWLAGTETSPIPIKGCDGRGIVYFAENHLTRIEPEDVRRREKEIVDESTKTANARDPFHRAHSNGYHVELQHGVTSDKDVGKLHELYRSVYREYVFPLTEDNVAELVQNPGSITAFIRGRNDDIVAAAVAEMAEIPVNGKVLSICEISDEATHPKQRGNGLNQACVQSLVDELMGSQKRLNLIYAEDRAVSRGVNQQSANLGWRFTGTLNRIGKIDADADIKVGGPYEDLNVWYYPM